MIAEEKTLRTDLEFYLDCESQYWSQRAKEIMEGSRGKEFIFFTILLREGVKSI